MKPLEQFKVAIKKNVLHKYRNVLSSIFLFHSHQNSHKSIGLIFHDYHTEKKIGHGLEHVKTNLMFFGLSLSFYSSFRTISQQLNEKTKISLRL